MEGPGENSSRIGKAETGSRPSFLPFLVLEPLLPRTELRYKRWCKPPSYFRGVNAERPELIAGRSIQEMSESAPTAADVVCRSFEATSASSSRMDMPIDEQLGKAEGFKSEGNQAYEHGQLTEALGKWHMALLHCAGINSFASMYGARSTEAENERAAGITSAVYNNMAACYLKQNKWDKAVYASSKALALAPKNLKALYRRAEAYLELGRNQLAARDVDLALDLRPEGKGIPVVFLASLRF